MNKKYKTICLLFYLITVIFFLLAIDPLLDGIKNLHNLNPVNDIIKVSITIILGILAIFFTLSAIVVQNILQKYSSIYLKFILSRVIFKVLLILLPTSAIFNLLLVYFGSNDNLEKLSLFLAIYIVISVAFAVDQLIDFLSISNIVSFISMQAFGHIKVIPDPGTIMRKKKNKYLLFLLKIKILLYKLISMKLFKRLVTTLNNDYSVLPKYKAILEDDVRPIFSTCRKALNEDDREAVLSCLDNLKDIAVKYLEKRKNYRGMEDRFLLFLNGQFEIIFNIAVGSYNQQYLEDIIKRVGIIALKCVELTDTQIGIGENGLVFVWIEFLKNSIWKTIDFKHTSAPTQAIKSIYQVGIELIEKDAFKTSVYSVGDSLQKIGENTSNMPGYFHALLTQNCIYGLLKMLEGFLRKIIKGGKIFSGIEVKKLCAMIASIMSNALNSKLDIYSYLTIPTPLVGSSWQDENISSIISDALKQECDDENKEYLFENIIYIIDCLGEISRKAFVKNKGHLDDYLMFFSEIVYHFSIYLSNFNDNFDTTDSLVLGIRKELSNLMNKLLENIMIIYNLYLSTDSFINIFYFSPVFAFLTYFADKEKSSKLLLEKRNLFISQLLYVYTGFKQKDGKDNKRNLYRHIKLFGAWIDRSKSNSIKKEIIKVLANEYEESRQETHHKFTSPLEVLGYPTGDVGDWYIYFSKCWIKDQWKVTDELNDKSNNYLNYKLYDKKIKKYFNLFVKKKKN